MPAFSDFMRALAEQMQLSGKGPVRSPAKGTPELPVTVNRRTREEAFRKAGYFNTPLDPGIYQDMDPATIAEMMDQYHTGVHNRVADDQGDKVYNVLAKDTPPGMLPEGADDPENTPYVRPDRRANFAPVPDLRVDPSVASPDWDSRKEPWQLIPEKGEMLDNFVMQRRAKGVPGYSPILFEGMTERDAARVIADQLKARRIKQMGIMSPDYLDTLPVY
jgi:hypothetical protein